MGHICGILCINTYKLTYLSHHGVSIDFVKFHYEVFINILQCPILEDGSKYECPAREYIQGIL